MNGLVSNLLIISTQLLLANGSQQIQKMIYKPYTYKLCRELCLASTGSFNFKREDSSCRRIPANDSSTQEINSRNISFTCLKKEKLNGITSLTVIKGWTICGKNIEDISDVTTEDLASGETSDHDDCNHSLHRACEEGNMCLVRYILSKGLVDINSRGKLMRTPVMTAARSGQEAIVDFLIRQGCDLSAVDEYNDTVIHLVCKSGYTGIVRKLVDSRSVDIEGRGKYCLTPLMASVYFGQTEVFEFLFKKGCNPKVVDDDRYTILHLACYVGHLDMVKCILSKRVVDIDSKAVLGRTPVMMAVLNGHVIVIDFLIKADCNLKIVDDKGYNILHLACLNGQFDVVKYILTNGVVDVNIKDYAGRTPFEVAELRGYVEVVKLLKYAVQKSISLHTSVR